MEDIEEVIVSWILKDEGRALAIKEQGFGVSMKESTICIRWGHRAPDVFRVEPRALGSE